MCLKKSSSLYLVFHSDRITFFFYSGHNNVILCITGQSENEILAYTISGIYVIKVCMMAKKKKKGTIRQYLETPVYWGVFWAALSVIIYLVNPKAGCVLMIAAALYIIVSLGIYLKVKKGILQRMIDYGSQYGLAQRQLLYELEVPYALLEENGKILWANEAMAEIFQGKNPKNKNVLELLEDMHPEYLQFDETDKNEVQIEYDEKIFNAVFRELSLKETAEDGEFPLLDEGEGTIVCMYLFDETQVQNLMKETRDEKLVTANIYIDNYDEVLQNVEPTRRTLLVALIDRRINIYFSEYDGIVRKLENDKYFVMFKTKYISKMQSNKFSVLDEVKTVNLGNGMPITISIGIGMGGKTLQESYELSTAAIDMALARGGDQAVLKDGNKVYYYGGKSKSVEKNTRVKSRVKATAFRDLIETKSEIYIMGHQIGDNDSFGASIGVYRICKTIGKKAHIVLGDMSSSVKELVEAFQDAEGYEDDFFVSGPEALERLDKNDALIVVDVSRADYTEYPELVRQAQCIVVFDHHRQTTDGIDHAQLSYVELSSSSASEMVVEIMQYINETVKLTKMEAEALYSGIMVDTNNFSDRTGVRTFEAAAYLKKSGADITRVRRMFREEMSDYKARATAIQNAEIYMDFYALSTYIPNGLEVSPTVVGAQAANELLNVKNVKASFVLTPYHDQVYISARSDDKVNVQTIMEEFGGGGHMNLAGAQVKDSSVEEVLERLKQAIKQKVEEGEL